jgi:RNA polymerase sigma-70 factor (ECF subfamily)
MSYSSEGTPDLVAFEQLVEEYGDRVYNIALRITGSPTDAEDAMQDAFLSALRGWRAFRGEASPTTWLYRIAVNAALQRVRPSRSVEYLGEIDDGDREEIADWTGDVPMAAVRSELIAELERGIGQLHPDLRVVLVLRDVEGLSTAETAASLDLSEAAVKSRLHRARVILRDLLSQYLA